MIQKNWQALIKPYKLDVKTSTTHQGVVVAEPLERGLGLTLGNALRRTLLSSLQGAAVTSLRIEGIQHEFSSIPGVQEDVAEIILNIKSLCVSLKGDVSKKISLSTSQAGPVTLAHAKKSHIRIHCCFVT